MATVPGATDRLPTMTARCVSPVLVTGKAKRAHRTAKLTVRLIARAPDVIFRAIPCTGIFTLITLLKI